MTTILFILFEVEFRDVSTELDYAYLAEFVNSERGRLTAVNASFTEVAAQGFPVSMSLGVAGRIRRQEGESDPELEIQIRTPGEGTDLDLSIVLSSEYEAVTYDRKVANVFAVNGPLVFTEPGLVEVLLSINGTQVRRLAFEVLEQP